MNSLVYFPAHSITETPADSGLPFADISFGTEDGERLHGWWVPARAPSIGHVLFCHGNAGNVGDRVREVGLLSAAGFDVLVFDYRGYGHSSGRPDEQGTYRDARAARTALLEQARVDGSRIVYVGESLGGAVALGLALEQPPMGLVLQSCFTSVRDLARLHYPFIPRALVPDAYPCLRLIRRLHAPLLVLHGERDDIVPPLHGQVLFEAAPGRKRIELFPDVGHDDLSLAGSRWAEGIAEWVESLEDDGLHDA
ncbi:MAG: alpha/beta hydrolase [Solirubrobacteraceae bacterium]